MLKNVKECMTEYMTTDRFVIFLKLWHDLCYSYYVKIFTQANQISSTNQSDPKIMANRKFNDFLNNTMEIIINAVKKVTSTTDKFFKTKKTIRKWMSITFISMFILESFFPLGKIVKGLVGNFVGGASGVVIFILGFLATCYIVVEATDPANGKNNKNK